MTLKPPAPDTAQLAFRLPRREMEAIRAAAAAAELSITVWVRLALKKAAEAKD